MEGRKRFPLWISNLLVFGFLCAVAVGYFLWQIHTTREAFFSKMQAVTELVGRIIELNARGAVLSQQATEEILFTFLANTARFIDYLDTIEPFKTEELTEFAKEARLSGICIFRADKTHVCEPVGIPDSLVYILPGGSFEITCDLSEVAQLPQGTINVMATYVNPLTFDPHYDGAGGCLPNDIGRTECFNLKPVVIPSGVTQMDIGAGAAAQKTFAELTFNPQQWDPRWVSENGPEISVQISSASAITCSNVDLSSIRMNGQAGIIPGSCMDTTGGITVKFSGSVAVLSLGSHLSPAQCIQPFREPS